MNTPSPTACPSWTAPPAPPAPPAGLHLRAPSPADGERAPHPVTDAAGVRLDSSRQPLGAFPLRLLAHLGEERGFAEWRDALLSGGHINNTEDRPAWHTALRAAHPPPEVHETLERMGALARRL